MAWRGLKSLGTNCLLVKSKDITHAGVLGKHGPTGLLVVPGGSARLKGNALGLHGLHTIRDWVANGGHYLGFCGGAGLALTQKGQPGSLGLSPARRAVYALRIHHFISGHVLASTKAKGLARLPVWWPGRFDCDNLEGQEIIARYASPADDLWLADLPYKKIPENFYKKLTEGNASPIPLGEPLILSGKYGLGDYVLSYAHLETPDSPDANTLLAELLQVRWGFTGIRGRIEPWNTFEPALNNSQGPILKDHIFMQIHEAILELVNLGLDLGLLFRRASWLVGWHFGLPGISLNNLLASLATLLECGWSESAEEFWNEGKEDFLDNYRAFMEGAKNYLWAERMSKTLSWQSFGEWQNKRRELFGHPMSGGGLIESLINFLDELIYLTQCPDQDSN